MTLWRTIPKLPMYEVSSDGQIRSKARSVTVGHGKERYRKVIPGKILAQAWIYRNGSPGYLTVKAAGQTLLVHRLVAMAWLPDTYAPGLEVNHKSGDKQDNRITNLEWVTHSQNELHSYRVLGKKQNRKKIYHE